MDGKVLGKTDEDNFIHLNQAYKKQEDLQIWTMCLMSLAAFKTFCFQIVSFLDEEC